MDVREALLQRVQKRIVRTREMLDRFDDRTAERFQVSDTWNVRDLVGHLAHWTDVGANRIPTLAVGGQSKQYDLDQANDEVYRKNRRMSFVMLVPQLRDAERRFIEAVRNVDSQQLLAETEVREWIETCIEHYDYHRPGLKEAVGRLEE